MNALALLALIFGFVGMLLLDGQVFTHAVRGIICGVIAAGCGLVLIKREPESRGMGWIFAVSGVALTIWCAVAAPSGYRVQDAFNRKIRERNQNPDVQKKLVGGWIHEKQTKKGPIVDTIEVAPDGTFTSVNILPQGNGGLRTNQQAGIFRIEGEVLVITVTNNGGTNLPAPDIDRTKIVRLDARELELAPPEAVLALATNGVGISTNNSIFRRQIR